MKRDGAKISLWQDAMQDFRPKAGSTENTVFDVVVVGGGVTGLTTALQLQKQGKRCVVAEAYQLCFGTTGGTTAHLNTFLDTTYDKIQSNFGEEDAQLVATAAASAIELYRTNIETYGIDCGFEQKDGYLYSQTKDQTKELDKIVTSSREAGVDVSYTDRIPLATSFEKAIVFHDQAQVHASKYVYGLAKAFEEAGGIILQDCQVHTYKDDHILHIETSKGVIKAAWLIWATHIPPGINLLHFRCAPYRSYAMAVTLKNDAYPDGLVYDMEEPYHYYRTQEVNGKKYLIAGGEDHKTAHEQNTEACFLKLEAHIRNIFEIGEVSFQWSSQYFEPSDGIAYIGHLPGNNDHVLVATGFGGNGMIYSHIAALLLTDLVTTVENKYAKLFSPGRIKPVAGFAKFIQENADVVAQFVGKRFSREKVSELAALAPGEGKVVKYEGSSIALYKDEKGGLHAVNPTCTHAKCIVDWNSAEKSWDCPCHGARYDTNGAVLTGPARKALEVIQLENLLVEKEL